MLAIFEKYTVNHPRSPRQWAELGLNARGLTCAPCPPLGSTGMQDLMVLLRATSQVPATSEATPFPGPGVGVAPSPSLQGRAICTAPLTITLSAGTVPGR